MFKEYAEVSIKYNGILQVSDLKPIMEAIMEELKEGNRVIVLTRCSNRYLIPISVRSEEDLDRLENELRDILQNARALVRIIVKSTEIKKIKVKSYAFKSERYFELTDAVAVLPGPTIKLENGFKRGESSDIPYPLIFIQVSQEMIFELFLKLIEVAGDDILDIVLRRSNCANKPYPHSHAELCHTHLMRENIDSVGLESVLCKYEDLLLNDGCMGVSIIWRHRKGIFQVQIDEHKNIIIGSDRPSLMDKVTDILMNRGIERNQRVISVSALRHKHITLQEYESQFKEMAQSLEARNFTPNHY